MRGRGLKLKTDALPVELHVSPPMRGRGLKLILGGLLANIVMSPPMRGRGLKQIWFDKYVEEVIVAPHAGAWIETGRNRYS